MRVKARSCRPCTQVGVIVAIIKADIATRITDSVVVAKTIGRSIVETEHQTVRLVDQQVVIGVKMLPILLHKEVAARTRAADFGRVVGEIDVFAVGIVEGIAPVRRSAGLQVDDVVADDDRLSGRTRAGTDFHHRYVFRRMVDGHYVVLDEAVITATENVDGVVVSVAVVSVVNRVATHSHMVGKGNIHRLAALVAKGAILNQKTIIVLIDVMALIIQPYVTVHKSTIHKCVIGILPFAGNPIDKVFVVFKIGRRYTTDKAHILEPQAAVAILQLHHDSLVFRGGGQGHVLEGHVVGACEF